MRRLVLRHQLALGAACSVILLTSILAVAPASAQGSPSVHSQTLEKDTLACYSVLGLNEVNAPSYVGLTVSRAMTKVRAAGGVSTYRIVAEAGGCLRNTLALS